MTRTTKRIVVGGMAAVVVAIAGVAAAQSVRQVTAIRVSNPGALLAGLDQLLESDALEGNRVSVVSVAIGGASPATHYIVGEFEDYADWESATERRLASRAWMTFRNTTGDAYEVLGRTLQVDRFVDGGDWREDDAAVVFNMTVSDPGAYIAAFQELMEHFENPGSVRVAEIRAGGMGSTHLVVATGESLAALNELLDEMFASDVFGTYASNVGDIRTINNVSQLRRIRIYN